MVYHCVMEKLKNGDPGALGALNHKQVVEFLKRDLDGIVNLAHALRSDPDLLDHLATFMLGRLENARHKEQLAAQQKLEV